MTILEDLEHLAGGTMKVTLIGIEKFSNLQTANGVECDVCGKRVNFDRRESRTALAELAYAGWSVPASTSDFRTPAYCPGHAKHDSAHGSGYQKDVQNDA